MQQKDIRNESDFRLVLVILRNDGRWDQIKEDLKQNIRIGLEGVDSPDKAYELVLELKALTSVLAKIEAVAEGESQ